MTLTRFGERRSRERQGHPTWTPALQCQHAGAAAVRAAAPLVPVRPAAGSGSSVAGGDDVRLDRIFGRIRRVARDHGTLVERARAIVGIAYLG